MLTHREFSQLSTAIRAMQGYCIANGGEGAFHIPQKNVLALLELYTEMPDEEEAPVETKEETP